MARIRRIISKVDMEEGIKWGEYGATRLMVDETVGETMGIKFRKISTFDATMGDGFMNDYYVAVDDVQPNIWDPYKIEGNVLTLYSDFKKTIGYEYIILD